MRPGWLTAVVAAVMSCLSFVSTGAASAPAEPPRTLRGASGSFPDYLDPQLSYTLEGWTAMYDTYIPLLTYRHASGKAGGEVIPGLARGLPKITDGGRTYTLFLRRGLKYSNGQPVKASDFESAVERVFRLNSPGAFFYTDIVGAERFWKTRRGGIGGIVTNNRTGKVTIHLVTPRGTFSDELALLFAAPVPPGTPARNQTPDPPPATGPYAITSSHPGSGWAYARNPEWKPNNASLMPQLPSGHVDKIDVAVIRNGSTQVDMVEQGKLDWVLNPPADRYAEVKSKYEGTQFRVEPNLSTYYFWMNTSEPPFDDLKVRRAVNYAIDSSALQRIYADQLAPSQQILPPGMPGYKKLELYPHDMAKAQRLIAEADPSDRKITVWTDSEAPNQEASAYYRDLLQALGFNARLKSVSAFNYFAVIGNLRTPNLDTGWGNWFEDYPHPNDFFEPILSGSSIRSIYNTNFAQVNVARLNQRIARLAREPGPVRGGQYAALDKSFMERAPWAPFGNLTFSTFVSEAIRLDKVIWNPTFGDDPASFEFR
jgi:peptide/nickel transport system substrate-binding protein